MAPDRLALQVRHMPDRPPVDLVLLKESGSLRVWSSHTVDGMMLVIEGVITGNGRNSPRFQRSGP